MGDKRVGLLKATKLEMPDGKIITIQEEIGRGASCIVYNAYYTDNISSEHCVRIKECYPVYLEIVRDKNGELLSAELGKEKFEAAKNRFKATYKKNVRIKNIQDLVNSTSNVNEIYEVNGTLYSMMSYDEGVDYSKHDDISLKEVCEHIKALAIVIQKYHNHGYLHLDIKPENVFIIPETCEHVLLFDFDSITTLQELQSNLCYRLSYSDGFSAPELVHGKIAKIGTQTDIYSLGAMLFYKVFGRKPTMTDGALGANYDFSAIKFFDDRYSTKLFKELTKVFHKTLATSSASRWNNVSLFIESMDRLIELSDLDSIYLQGKFTYNTKNFVGRSGELKNLHVELNNSNVVFLSGIGGIGKTEIAKRYAYINRDNYDNIFFLPFSNSLEETFCSNELRINTIEREADESTSELFKRKLEALKKVATAKDLLIIDNFDVDYDERLETVLSCPCKFIVTTREDFSDYNYPQIEIDYMEEFDDIYAVFKAYNSYDYLPEKEESIKGIIELVERHTMTVELFAKYMRDNVSEDPEVLLKKVMEKEGVTSFGDIDIKHRKDRRLRKENVTNHLLALFDLSGFTKLEEELIKSLALLGYIKITKKRFFDFFTPEGNEEALQNLIKRGWIEYDELKNKVSLHQIILDLVLNHLKPTSSDCPRIMAAMLKYMEESQENNVAEEIRKKLMDAFMERIIGNDLLYAKLCVANKKNKYLSKAEDICKASSDREAKDILQKIYRLYLKYTVKVDNIIDAFDNPDEFCKEKKERLLPLIEQAVQYAKEFSEDPTYLANFYMALTKDILFGSDISSYELYFTDEHGYNLVLDCLYRQVAELYNQAEIEILRSVLPEIEKIRYIRKIQEFYIDDDCTAEFRCKNYSDTDKALHYQNLIDELRKSTAEEGNNIDASDDNVDSFIDLSDLTYGKLAEIEISKENYEKAIEYLLLQSKTENLIFYSITLSKIADLYEKLGNNYMMRTYLISALDYDKEKIADGNKYASYSSYICNKLILSYMLDKEYKEAERYAKEMVYYNTEDLKENRDICYIKYIIAANYILYKLASSSDEKEAYWKECIRYFEMIGEEEELPEEITLFLLEDLNKTEDIEEKIKKAYVFFYRCEDDWLGGSKADFLNYILELCENDDNRILDFIIALTRYSEYCRELPRYNAEEALKYALQAQVVLEENNIEDEFCQSLVYKELGECYASISSYEYEQTCEVKSKCNYHLIATIKGNGRPVDVKIALLETAADSYSSIDKSEEQKQCLIEGVSLLESVEIMYDDEQKSTYVRLLDSLIKCCAGTKDKESLKLYADKMLHIIISGFFERVENDEEYDWYDFGWKIEDIAFYLKLGDCVNEAILFYILAVIVGISSTPSKEILSNIDTNIGLTVAVSSEFSSAIHGDVSVQGVDVVLGVYKELQQLLQDNSVYRNVEQEFLWFMEQYQKQDVEFKRE